MSFVIPQSDKSRVLIVFKKYSGSVIVQHDPDDFAALPKFPESLN